ncbi:MAG: hydrogenase nickel incorporation protein HypB [Phycisphaerales bacterium]|nr:hydrogenase nickel incorporation protein HypB [Phycisphaerales bacterium]
MKIDVLKNVFQKNENAAAENRARLDELGITCVNLLGGAGSGKTSILEAVVPKLCASVRVAVLEGDLATTKDADRIARLNVPVVQLLTGGGCHLNATLVQHALNKLPTADLDLLIIENVGNPICPANFDLGEHLRISVLSVAEGDDKPAKYPLLFKDVDAVLITKCDLLAHVGFDFHQVWQDIRRLNPKAEIIETSVSWGTGMRRLSDWLTCRSAPLVEAKDESQAGSRPVMSGE